MTAWIIQRADVATPLYFTVRDGEWAYTADVTKALRLARGQDATALLTSLFFVDATVRLIEQVFPQQESKLFRRSAVKKSGNV